MRKAALPAKADEYKVGTTPAFKPPEGIEFKIDEDNPLWSQARALAHEAGLSQDNFAKFVDLFVGYQVTDQQRQKTAADQEIAKAGAAAPVRVTAINTWMDAYFGPEIAPPFKATLVTERQIRGWEKIITGMTNGGAAPFSQSHRDPGAQQGLVSEEQFNKMSAADRLDYTRSPAAVAARARAGT